MEEYSPFGRLVLSGYQACNVLMQMTFSFNNTIESTIRRFIKENTLATKLKYRIQVTKYVKSYLSFILLCSYMT